MKKHFMKLKILFNASSLKRAAKAVLWTIAALVLWIGLWALGAARVGKTLILPSPLLVTKTLLKLACTKEFWTSVGGSIRNIVFGYSVGAALGVFLGVVCYFVSPIRKLISPLLTVVRATPVASFVILTVVFLERPIIPVVMVGMMVLPIVWGNTLSGLESTDKKLLEMASSYEIGKLRTLTKIYAPSAATSVLSGLATSIGLAWKAGIAAEILITPKGTIGEAMNAVKAVLQIPELFAYTLAVILISLLFELIFRLSVGYIKRRGAR